MPMALMMANDDEADDEVYDDETDDERCHQMMNDDAMTSKFKLWR